MAQTKKAYGIRVPFEYSDLEIELMCLAARHPKEKGGLGHHGHLCKVMKMLWPHKYEGMIDDEYPRWSEYVELMTWAWCEDEVISVFGHASAGKSDTYAYIAVAEYLADPFHTAVVITSTHMQGLKNRIFGYVFQAANEISHICKMRVRRNPVPAVVFPGINDDKLTIQGIATNKSEEAVDKIQGIHTKRVIVLIDEAAGTPPAIFSAAANLRAGTTLFRHVMLMNPDDLASHAATWAEPKEGFKNMKDDDLPFWKTKRGGLSVHLSWNRSPNKKAGRTVYPYLIDQAFVDNIINTYGEDSPEYYKFALGWFPPAGMQGYVFSPAILDKAEKPKDFPFKPIMLGALDPAFEGGDQSALAIGEFYPETSEMNFMDIASLKIDASSNMPMDFLTAKACMTLAQQYNIRPENFIMDTTGGGRGVYNILYSEWSTDVQSCAFGQNATKRRFRDYDPDVADELVDRFVSELWWAARMFCQEGMIGGINQDKARELREDLLARRYVMHNSRLVRVEKKEDMIKRLGRSPDKGDAFCMLIELMRRKGASPKDPVKNFSMPMKRLSRKMYNLQVEDWETGGKEPENEYALSFDPY